MLSHASTYIIILFGVFSTVFSPALWQSINYYRFRTITSIAEQINIISID